jgi:hypothetical protein
LTALSRLSTRSLRPESRLLTPSLIAAGLIALSAACGDDENARPVITPNIRPVEEEVFEADTIRGLAIEDVRAIFSQPSPVAGFSDRLPLLVVSAERVTLSAAPGRQAVHTLHVSHEGGGPFEWDYVLVGEQEWLSGQRPLNTEEGDIDSLTLTADATGLPAGVYSASVLVVGIPVARESPREIEVTFIVTGR